MRALSGTLKVVLLKALTRVRSKPAATAKMEFFVIIVNGWKPLIIITKSSILDVAAALDPSLLTIQRTFSDD